MNFLLKIYVGCLRVVYFFMKIFPAQNKVVMITRQSNETPDDFELLGKELGEKHEVVYLCKTLDGGVKSTITAKISYGGHMMRQIYHLATARVCILDSYCPAVSILNHKKSLTVVQIWHSIGTMKKFGYTSLGKAEGRNTEIARIMRMHKNYSFAVCSGKAYAEHLAKGFGMPVEKIKIFTLPRVDLLKSKEYEKKTREKIFERYPELKERKNVLYAPTFRKNEKEMNKKVNELVKNFDFEKYNLIVKMHPLSKTKIKNTKVICDMEFSTFEMLFVADKMISDYSCVVYEAGVRGIPLYFYDFDLEKYLEARGLAIDYDELPGFKEKSGAKLVKDLEKKYDMKTLEKFIDKYVENTDDCTVKLAREIEKYLP